MNLSWPTNHKFLECFNFFLVKHEYFERFNLVVGRGDANHEKRDERREITSQRKGLISKERTEKCTCNSFIDLYFVQKIHCSMEGGSFRPDSPRLLGQFGATPKCAANYRTISCIFELPRDILYNIFHLLNLRDLYSLDNACCGPAHRPHLLNAFASMTRLPPLIDFALCAWMAIRFPNVREFRTDSILLLNHDSKLTPGIINAFCHLETLVLQEYLDIDDAFLDGLATHVRKSLRSLTISNLYAISDRALARLLRDCTELRSLRLSSPAIWTMTEAGATVRALENCKHLVDVRISDVVVRSQDMSYISSTSLEVMQLSLFKGAYRPEFSPALHCLRVLQLSGAIDPRCLVQVITSCSVALTEFTVFPHDRMDCSDVFPALVQHTPQLRSLRVSVLCSFSLDLFLTEVVQKLTLLKVIEFRQHDSVGRFGDVFCDDVRDALRRTRGDGAVSFQRTTGLFDFGVPLRAQHKKKIRNQHADATIPTAERVSIRTAPPSSCASPSPLSVTTSGGSCEHTSSASSALLSSCMSAEEWEQRNARRRFRMKNNATAADYDELFGAW